MDGRENDSEKAQQKETHGPEFCQSELGSGADIPPIAPRSHIVMGLELPGSTYGQRWVIEALAETMGVTLS